MAWIGTLPAAWHASDPIAPTSWLSPYWQVAMVVLGGAVAVLGGRLVRGAGQLATAGAWLAGAGVAGNGAGALSTWASGAGNSAADIWSWGGTIGNPADASLAIGVTLIAVAVAVCCTRRYHSRWPAVGVILAGIALLGGVRQCRLVEVAATLTAQPSPIAARLLASRYPAVSPACLAAYARWLPGTPASPACGPWLARYGHDPLLAVGPHGKGSWLATPTGGVSVFGSAKFYGSMAGHHLNKPIVGIAATPNGKGYWLAAADGGVFAFGDARFYGSLAGKHLNAPIVGIAPDRSTGGYRLAAAGGCVWTMDPHWRWHQCLPVPRGDRIASIVDVARHIGGYALLTGNGRWVT
jgi:hypothetical protein